MNIHAFPPQAHTTAINDDAATQLQDEINSALMMAHISATLICEAFDGARPSGDFQVSKLRSDMIVFASSDTSRRLREIDAAFEKLTLGQG